MIFPAAFAYMLCPRMGDQTMREPLPSESALAGFY